MSLSNGRTYLAIPGPSVMPDRVLQAMHSAAPNIYEGDLVETTRTIVTDLKAVARTKGQVAMYIGNGHAAWEASLANTLQAGDKILALVTGHFGEGWAAMATALGVTVDTLEFDSRSDIDLAQVTAALSDDKTHSYKAVIAVHVDTSTSALNDISGLRQALDAAGHPALLMVDCIASLAVDRFEMDAWGVDVMVAASQKGLMTPPGMSFVFFSDKAAEVRKSLPLVSNYWDWTKRSEPDVFYQYWCGTAPTHHIFGLRTALDMIVHEEGIEAAWARQATLAKAVWAAFEAWSTTGGVQLNIADPSKRSNAVTMLRTKAPHGTQLRQWVEQNAGVTLGIGVGMAALDDPEWHGFFRVGHMGHVNAHMVLGTLATIEAGMKAVGIPHNPGGVAAAVNVISQV